VIRKALGTDDVDITVEGLFPWTIDSAIAERFQVRPGAVGRRRPRTVSRRPADSA